jgi:hypothetical protein
LTPKKEEEVRKERRKKAKRILVRFFDERISYPEVKRQGDSGTKEP